VSHGLVLCIVTSKNLTSQYIEIHAKGISLRAYRRSSSDAGSGPVAASCENGKKSSGSTKG
jgi:hypothetical protein